MINETCPEIFPSTIKTTIKASAITTTTITTKTTTKLLQTINLQQWLRQLLLILRTNATIPQYAGCY